MRLCLSRNRSSFCGKERCRRIEERALVAMPLQVRLFRGQLPLSKLNTGGDLRNFER